MVVGRGKLPQPKPHRGHHAIPLNQPVAVGVRKGLPGELPERAWAFLGLLPRIPVLPSHRYSRAPV